MSAGTSIACDCAPNPPVKEALSEATIVFKGRVDGIKSTEHRLEGRPNGRKMVEVKFSVREVWKGDVSKILLFEQLRKYQLAVSHSNLARSIWSMPMVSPSTRLPVYALAPVTPITQWMT
jgi:hypothetical protein